MPEAAIAAPPPKPTGPPSTPKPAPPPTRPSAPPPRPPTPRPAPPKPEPKNTASLDDAFADIDGIEAKDAASKAPRKPDKKPEAKDERKSSEEDNADSVEEVPKNEAGPEAEAKTDEKTETTEEAKPVRAAELRTAYEKSKTTLKEKDAEITRLKGELESKAKTEDPEKKTLVERLSTTEKKLKEYEDEIRFTNYKNHPEFKEKYETPYHNAFARAVHDFEQISVVDDEGNKRPATRKDLDLMLSIPLGNVDDIAAEKYGHSAARVVRHVEKLRELSDAYHGALEEAKTKGGEREKTMAIEAQRQNEAVARLWQEQNDAITKKYPEWFKQKEGDSDWNGALEKGQQLATKVFIQRDKETPENLIKLDAKANSKLLTHGVLILTLKRRDAKIAELEKTLKEFEASEPTADGDEPPKRDGGGNWEDSANAELDALDRKSKR